MKDAYVSLHERLPKVAQDETRVVTVVPHSGTGVPPGSYAYIEAFCDEEGCDCRRVFFNVFSQERRQFEAVIAYGWETAAFYTKWFGGNDPKVIAEMQGPVLNLGSRQSKHAPALLKLAQEALLSDAEYMERVKRHYEMFRATVDGERPERSRTGRKPLVVPRNPGVKKRRK